MSLYFVTSLLTVLFHFSMNLSHYDERILYVV